MRCDAMLRFVLGLFAPCFAFGYVFLSLLFDQRPNVVVDGDVFTGIGLVWGSSRKRSGRGQGAGRGLSFSLSFLLFSSASRCVRSIVRGDAMKRYDTTTL